MPSVNAIGRRGTVPSAEASTWRMRFKVTPPLLWPTSTGAMPSLRTSCLTTLTMAAHSTQAQPFRWKV